MKTALRRILKILFGILISVLVLVGVLIIVLPRLSFPTINGTVRLPGLDGKVEVIRDQTGIPHIYATTTHDLFMAQGYVHAQDRFFQMDFFRASATGTLSALFGSGQFPNDAFIRTVGWGRTAQAEYNQLDAETKAVLDAYAAGVNAYLDERQGPWLSLEYTVVALLSPNYQPAAWEGYHSLAWAKVMAYDLGGNMRTEIERAILLKSLTSEELAEISPAYPEEMPVTVPNFNLERGQVPSSLLAERSAELDAALAAAQQNLNQLGALLGAYQEGLGSNNWVIGGSRTATGMPILADDMHLGEQMPSIWYEVDLQCQPVGPACPYQITGYSFAGVPGVIVGHNARIAWGFTNVGPDVQDLYIEKINPANPNQYEYMGEWVDMKIIEETLSASDGTEEALTIRYTRHGPIITDVFGGLRDFENLTSSDLPSAYAIALSWTALEELEVVDAILGINQARNWDEFRQAAQFFAAPSQNMVYADIDGNIGYQTPGNIPIRADGHDGLLPVPGWTGEYEWQGFIPFDELPYLYNPPADFIATANNAVVDDRYPYSISQFWSYGHRAQRIVEMIEQAPGLITPEYVAEIHGDNKDLNAAALVPVLITVDMDEELQPYVALLSTWDYQNHMDSAPAALFNAFWKHLLNMTFNDQLPERYWPGGGSRWFVVVRNLLDEPESNWWDDASTPGQRETRDEIFAQAFSAAVNELEETLGKDTNTWRWGDLHTTTFHNPSLGQSGIAIIEAIFNRGPYPTSGGSDMVNAASWSATSGDYTVSSGVSERLIVDLSNFDNSRSVITTGASGHVGHPHYDDQIDPWRLIQYHNLYWIRSTIEANQSGTLVLEP
jgi:penicillin amidase